MMIPMKVGGGDDDDTVRGNNMRVMMIRMRRIRGDEYKRECCPCAHNSVRMKIVVVVVEVVVVVTMKHHYGTQNFEYTTANDDCADWHPTPHSSIYGGIVNEYWLSGGSRRSHVTLMTT